MASEREPAAQELLLEFLSRREDENLRRDVSIIQTRLEESYVKKDGLWGLIEARMDDRYVQKEEWFRRSWVILGWILAFLVTGINVAINFSSVFGSE